MNEKEIIIKRSGTLGGIELSIDGFPVSNILKLSYESYVMCLPTSLGENTQCKIHNGTDIKIVIDDRDEEMSWIKSLIKETPCIKAEYLSEKKKRSSIIDKTVDKIREIIWEMSR